MPSFLPSTRRDFQQELLPDVGPWQELSWRRFRPRQHTKPTHRVGLFFVLVSFIHERGIALVNFGVGFFLFFSPESTDRLWR
jgi:hypothetical protein